MAEIATKHYVTRAARPLGKGERIARAVRDIVMLALIEWQHMYGVEIIEEYCWTTGEDIPSGSVYTTLRRLRDRGWIVSVQSKTNEGWPCKRHKLTKSGAATLRQFRRFIAGV